MITRTTAYTIDLDRGTVETRWDNPLTYGDKGADRIQVTLTRGSSPATLSGLSVMLYGVRSDGITAIKAGSVSGNVVTAELDYTFYAIPGRLELLLQLSEGTTVVNTPLRITAYVKSGQTDEVVSTGEQFSLAELQAVVAACQSATSSATSATSSANNAAAAANAAAASANTAAGNAQDAADAITGITIDAETLETGEPATASAEFDAGDGHLSVSLGLPKGGTGTRGSLIYSGTAITGTSTTPTVYSTGITDAKPLDLYRYNGTDSANIGNIYECTLGGDAETALWVYDGNIRGVSGSGNVSYVDGISPDGNGDVTLDAVRFGVDQTAVYSDTEKAQARTNMGAASVAQSVPTGGAIGQALIKSGATDYATEWATIPRQYTTMPTITAELLGLVAQYVGVTGTYTFGHFYAAVSDGEATPTYSWSEIVYGDPNSVSYSAQTGKTEAEKLQARTNIGAAATSDTITAFGEIGYSTYTTVYGQVTAIKQPNGKYTISICAVLTAVTRAANVYYFISTSKIVALLGLTGTMTIANDKGTRTLTTAPVTSSQIGYGLVAEVNSNLQAIGYGRVYTTSGNVGSWSLSDTVTYTVNAQYLIWLYDITIA